MRSLTGLKTLPRELLSQILQLDIEYCALSLWKCGDKQLNYVLATGGITMMTLRSSNSATQNRWPSLLKNFRCLQNLAVINTRSSLGDLNMVRRELLQLPSTLRMLKLYFKDAEEAILEEPNPFALFPLFFGIEECSTNSLPGAPIEHATEKQFYSRRTWIIKDIFPKLEHLEIKSFDPSKTSFELVGLPEGLIGLKIDCCPNWTLENTELLPRSLETIDLGQIHITGPEVLKQLPPGLRSLQKHISWKDGNTELSQYFPESLTEIGFFIPSQANWSSIFPPPKLTTFSLPHIGTVSDESLIAKLPCTLTKLTIPGSWYTEAVAASLPSSLLELDLMMSVSSVESQIFPPQLTALRLRGHTSLDTVGSLPPSLESLYLRKLEPDSTARALSMLPRSLLSFSLSWNAKLILRSESNLLPAISLPPKLTIIPRVEFIFSGNDPADMLAKLVLLLPRTLTELATSFSYYDALLVRNNYADLQKATFQYGSPPKASGYIWPEDAVAALPRGLRVLSITGSIHIAGFHYNLLPRSLTGLHIQGEPNVILPVVHHHLTRLPPNLVNYDASRFRDSREVFHFETSNEQIETEAHREDPKPFIITDTILNHFIVPDSTTYIVPENWVDALPRTLYSLFIPLPLKGADCAQLPRSLKYLSVRSIDSISSEHLRALPRRLGQLNAPLFPAVSKSPSSSVCRTEALTASCLPPYLNSAYLGGQNHVWLSYRNWANKVRNLPPLPYAIAFPTNPSDPYRLHEILQID